MKNPQPAKAGLLLQLFFLLQVLPRWLINVLIEIDAITAVLGPLMVVYCAFLVSVYNRV